ncbi:hypothetical protein [Priestia filamentosa]|uniref:hypothetical protein n=1 Tax=Priestia filamentosa TaxID=1402861 RepID=UPI00111BFF3F|nr:hypothetical protein [Priestia filamentosa]
MKKHIIEPLPNYESTYYYFCTACRHKETYSKPVIKLSCCGAYMDHIEVEGKRKPVVKRKEQYEQLTLI